MKEETRETLYVMKQIIIGTLIVFGLSKLPIVEDFMATIREGDNYDNYQEISANDEVVQFEEIDEATKEDMYMEHMLATTVYFINNGFYYHEDINCKGLEGYDNLNEVEFVETQYYPNLKACNWCTEITRPK